MPKVGSTASAGLGSPEGTPLLEFVARTAGRRGVERLDEPDRWRGQCVSLVARYVQENFLQGADRTRKRSFGDGRDVARGIGRQFPEHFEPATTSGTPRAGAVVSFEGRGPTRRYGHTAVITDVRGEGRSAEVRVLESNHDDAAEQSITRLSGWIPLHEVGGLHGRALGWSNPRTSRSA